LILLALLCFINFTSIISQSRKRYLSFVTLLAYANYGEGCFFGDDGSCAYCKGNYYPHPLSTSVIELGEIACSKQRSTSTQNILTSSSNNNEQNPNLYNSNIS